MKTINPGELRHQVIIQKPKGGTDSFGQPLQAWTTIATLWGKIETLRASEQYQTAAFVSEVTHRITTHWPGSALLISPEQRALIGTNVYLIQAVDNVEMRNVYLELMCLQLNATSASEGS